MNLEILPVSVTIAFLAGWPDTCPHHPASSCPGKAPNVWAAQVVTQLIAAEEMTDFKVLPPVGFHFGFHVQLLFPDAASLVLVTWWRK